MVDTPKQPSAESLAVADEGQGIANSITLSVLMAHATDVKCACGVLGATAVALLGESAALMLAAGIPASRVEQQLKFGAEQAMSYAMERGAVIVARMKAAEAGAGQ